MSLKSLRTDIVKKHGSDSVVSFNSMTQIKRRSTGSLLLDETFGGGIPEGRIIQLFGPPSGGKSALALHIAGKYYNNNLGILYVDAENSIVPEYTKQTFGFDILDEERVLFSQEQEAGKVYDIINTSAKSGLIKLVIIDSTDALMTVAEEEGEFGDAHIGQMARMNSSSLKRIISVLNEHKVDLIFLSQIRANIGSYGGGESVSGGNSIPFYSAIRARISKAEFIKENNIPIGQIIKIVTHKNKVAPPFRSCEVSLYYGKGLDTNQEIVDLGVQYGFIHKAGAWYSLPEPSNERIGQGKINASKFLDDHEEIKNEILKGIKEKMGLSEPDQTTQIESQEPTPKRRSKKDDIEGINEYKVVENTGNEPNEPIESN